MYINCLPVRICAVRALPVRSFPHDEGVVGDSVFIELDTETGRSWQWIAVNLKFKHSGEQLARIRRANLVLKFKHGEVVGGDAEMHAGGGGDRAERIVRHQIDVMRFAPTGDL